MKSTLIKDTTKAERIALIKEWIPADDGLDDADGLDLWELYADYINGTKEIAECNAAFSEKMYSNSEDSGMTYEHILTEEKGKIFVMTLNRVRQRNALSSQMWAEMIHALEYFENNDDLWVLVLTNNGPSFCAGADIKELATDSWLPPKGYEDWGLGGLIHHFFKKPIIAAVNGMALGGGTEIVLACDLAVASEDAKFGLPEVGIGMVANGGMLRICRQVPIKFAMEMALTGDPIDAQTAKEWGLVNRVVPGDEVLSTAMALAERICQNAPLSVRYTKESMYKTMDMNIMYPSEAWEINDYYTELNLKTEDKIEGNRAFVEKRKPEWKGR